jgi:alkaline phosphatase D
MRRRTFLFLSPLAIPTARALARQRPASAADLLRSGPMLGYSETTETVVWLQTWRPCRAQLRFWRSGAPSTARLSDEVATTGAGDMIARFRLSRLEPGTRFEYELYLDGERVERPYPLAFQTQAIWRYRADPPAARFAIGSCAYVNDAPYDRPGELYGQKMEIFRAIAEARPDAMVWLGDNWYYREGDFFSNAGLRYRAAHTRSLAEMQPLLGATHHYAIWDDHDFGPNDADESYRMRETSLGVFKDYWANPGYGTAATPGVFSRFEWNDVELFLLDDRYHRTPNASVEPEARRMFGAAQLTWLEEALRSSRATFKIVAGGNQMLNPIADYEGFSRVPVEQNRLFSFLRAEKIPGVVFLSGDRHHTELLRRDEPGLYPLYEFTSSALTSGGGRLAAEANNPARVPGTWLTETRNFGLVDLGGPPKARTLTLRALDYTGKERWRHEIQAAELAIR